MGRQTVVLPVTPPRLQIPPAGQLVHHSTHTAKALKVSAANDSPVVREVDVDLPGVARMPIQQSRNLSLEWIFWKFLDIGFVSIYNSHNS
jgi:hypothetical protein